MGVREFCASRGITVADFGRMIGLPLYDRESKPLRKQRHTYTSVNAKHRLEKNSWTLKEFMKMRQVFGLSDLEAIRIMLGKWEGAKDETAEKMQDMRSGIHAEELNTEVLQP